MNIDEIYGDYEATQKAISELRWQNATATRVFIGREDHGILTASLHLEGKGWGQGFGGRILTEPAAFQNFIKGLLMFMPLEHGKELKKHLRVGRDGNDFGAIVALRPLIEDGPIFWPGNLLEQRRYLFIPDGRQHD